MIRSENPPRLLALCARAQGHPRHYEQLKQQAARLTNWPDLLQQAESHGLTPLLYTHLQAAGISLPAAVRPSLQARLMQHTHANLVRAKTLAEILTVLQQADIPVLVLKGAALAQLVYPHPGLRPMRDMDLLLPAADAQRAQALLAEIGFSQPSAPMDGLSADHHHLTAIKRRREGFSVSVELHHALNLNEPNRPPRHFAEFAPTAQPFPLYHTTAYTLGPEAMLWHVYRHAFCMPLLYEPTRLIWVADLISLVEQWYDQLDWAYLRQHYPAAYHMLPFLHHFTPWSEQVAQKLRLPRPTKTRTLPLTYQGWPRYLLLGERTTPFWPTLRATFFPTAAWLHLVYGQKPTWAGYGRAWAAHQQTLWPHIRQDFPIHRHHYWHRVLHKLSRIYRKGGSPS